MATTDNDLRFNLDNTNEENECCDDNLVNLQNCLKYNCGYYTDSEVNNLHQQLCRNITLSTLTVNCRSLSKNFDKLEYTMKSLNFNFDCIGLTETWLKGNEETNIYNMSGYTLLSKTRSHKRCGGVGLYISDRFNYKTRDDLIAVTEECPFEWLFIEAEVDNNAMGSRYFWLIARWRWYATQIFTVPEVPSFTCKLSTALATKQHNRNKANGILCGFVS